MFPLDPLESRDTDGDGVGNNADADDDGDGVSDSEDSTPLGDDFVSLLNGDGVPQVVADLLSGALDSHTFAMTIESSQDEPNMAVGYGPQVFELYSDGTYERIDWTDSDKGVWSWSEETSALQLSAERGYVEMGVRLTDWFAPEDLTDNVDLWMYERSGAPELEIEVLSDYTLVVQSDRQYSNHWIATVTRAQAAFVVPASVPEGAGFIADTHSPSLPRMRLSCMPEERYIAWTSTNAFTEDEITGVWAIEASLPSDEWDCGPDCGGLFTFHGNGEGEVTREFIDQSGQLSEDTTQFGWVLNEAGNVELSITDVDGVTEISRHRVYDDKLAALQVRTTVTDASAGETRVRGNLGLAIRRDADWVNTLADTSALYDVPLLSGFYQTSPFVMENANGDAADNFGFVLGTDGTVTNFFTEGLTPYALMRPVYSREGEVSGTTTIDLEFCNDFMPIGEELEYPGCGGADQRHRSWEVMSIRDTDGDEQVDRVYVLETIRRKQGGPVPAPVADQFVMSGGVVAEAWDRGINAFDAAIDYAECNNDGGEGCPSIGWEFVADEERGDVLQVTHADNDNFAGLFIGSSNAVNSAYATGALQFDIKVVSGDANITMKLDCFYPCSSGDRPLGEKGVSDWETVAVPMQELVDGGLDLTQVNTGLVIWASQFTDTVFQIDNVRFVAGETNGPAYLWKYARTNFYDIGRDYDINDVDADGVANTNDALPLDYRDAIDTDLDGIGDSIDSDDDGDGVPDILDAFPLDPSETVDSDGDGIGNASDSDDDGDSVPDRLDAFPYDPSESIDTDGDGVGDNRDEDDDNDGIPDDRDDSPQGEGYLDDDGDGVINRDDADLDGDGVPEVIAELLEGKRNSLAIAAKPRGPPEVIPGVATPYDGYYATLYADGTFEDGAQSHKGLWEWSTETQSINFEQEPFVYYPMLNQTRFINIDRANLGQYESQQVAVKQIRRWRYTLKPSLQEKFQWSVVSETGVEEYIDTEQMPDAASVLIDPFAPIYVEDLGEGPAEDYALMHEAMVNPIESKQLIGSWGLNAVVPGDQSCFIDNGWLDDYCGRVFEFRADGVGSVDGRPFTWDVARDGTAVLSMLDGSGSIRFVAQEAFADDSVHIFALTRSDGQNYAWFSHAVKRSPSALSTVDLQALLRGATLINGWDATTPVRRRNEDGELIEGWGFDLAADGSLVQFSSQYLGPFSGAYVKPGQWHVDGSRISMGYCQFSDRQPDGDSKYPDGCRPWLGILDLLGGADQYPGVSELSERQREWEVLSAVDLNDDGRVDRLYVVETVTVFIGDCVLDELLQQNYGFSVSDMFGRPIPCRDGRLVYGSYRNTLFYDLMPEFDYADVDRDGVLNHEDFAPHDPAETSDTDGDGVGDNADQFPTMQVKP